MKNEKDRVIALITTGGTIASEVDQDSGLANPKVAGDRLLERVGGGLPNVQIEIHDLCCLPSPHMCVEVWISLQKRITELAARGDISGIVVTHGTATMEETAWFLEQTLQIDKPVVLTGAQLNFSMRDSDGPRNLKNAIKACCSDADLKGRVTVCFDGKLYSARGVRKFHTTDLDAFIEGQEDPIGQIDGDGAILHKNVVSSPKFRVRDEAMPRVDIVAMYADADGSLLHSAVAAGADGVVIQAVSTGHVNSAMGKAISEVLSQGIPVVVSTKVPFGGTRACYGFEGSSKTTEGYGAVLSNDISPWKARITLMLAIHNGMASRDELLTHFSM